MAYTMPNRGGRGIFNLKVGMNKILTRKELIMTMALSKG